MQQQLAAQLAKVESDDIEQLMYALRTFKQINVLRVAAADIMGAASLMTVSDYLSYIAEVILEQAVNIAWAILAEKNGLPDEHWDIPRIQLVSGHKGWNVLQRYVNLLENKPQDRWKDWKWKTEVLN